MTVNYHHLTEINPVLVFYVKELQMVLELMLGNVTNTKVFEGEEED